MNTQNILQMADRIDTTTAQAFIADTNKKTVYQWQTPRGAVVMEFLNEEQARNWYNDKIKTPTGAFVSDMCLFKIETTNITTKL